MRFKKLIEILSLSFEYMSQIQIRRSDEPVLHKLKPLLPEVEKTQNKPPKPGKKQKLSSSPHSIKNSMLFYAYFSRLGHELSPDLAADLDILLRQAHHLIIGIVEMTGSKRWLTPVVEAIQISQMVTQAVWSESSRTGRNTNLLQLPYFTDEMIRKLNNKKWKISSTLQFLQLEQDQRREFLIGEGLSESQIHDIEVVRDTFPHDVEMICKAHVEDDEENLGITAGSVVTLTITFERPSKPGGVLQVEKPKEDPELLDVHAPFFPMAKKELWWIIVADSTNNLAAMKRVPVLKNGTEVKIPFMAPRKPGIYIITVSVMSDSYVGFDKQKQVKLQVGKEVKYEEKPQKDEDDLDSEGEEEKKNEESGSDEGGSDSE